MAPLDAANPHRPLPTSDAEVRTRLRALADSSGMLEEIFTSAPVGLQIFARDGRCVVVNPRHTELFGAVPPPDYNVFEDTQLIEGGVVELLRRGFAGERILVPPIWYDARQLKNVAISSGRRLAVSAELVPLPSVESGAIEHVLFVFHDVTETESAREHAEAAAAEATSARAEAENAARHAEFLAEAGRLLSSTLDYEVTLAELARLSTPTLADFCIVDLVVEDGSLRRVAASHADSREQPVLDELCLKFPPRIGSPQPAMVALTNARPFLMSEVDSAFVAQHTLSEEHAQLIMRLGVRSHLTVPLLLGERVLGTISLGFVGARRYGTADVPLAEALASRAAVAIENARLYRRAEQARAEAEAASRAKDQFLAMLGHELRNPLAPIVTALDLMRMREGSSHERNIIERQVAHVRRLVDDLLDVARITRGRLELALEPVELVDPVMEAVEATRPLITQRDHALFVDCAASGLVVRGDRVRLAQVVANLLSNAARYSEPGGTIRLSVARNEGELVLRVADTGVGIAPELLPRIFELFAQGEQALDRASGGRGLGLAIVKSLVALHGGRVGVSSAGSGRGSVFEVVLPALLHVEVTRSSAPPLATPERVGSRASVLIVDDNEDAAELLGQALARRGYTTLVAHDGHAALELAARHAPELALLDIGLPGMDGHELAQHIVRDPALAAIRLVALTGYGQASDRARTKAAGFAAHLVKPVDLAHLESVLERLLSEPTEPQ